MPDDLLTAMAARCLWFNGILVPVGSAESTLGRYADYLVEFTGHDPYVISLASSAVLLYYRSHYIAVCTRHQMRGRNHQAIGLMDRSGGKLVTCAGKALFDGINESDFHDLAVFDFTDPCLAGVIDKRRFFEFERVPPGTPDDAVAFVVCAGFAYIDQAYNLDEGHLGSAKRIVACTPGRRSNDPAVLWLKLLEPMKVSPDGMSGGSAFSCVIVGGEATAYFAGVIVRGSKGELAIVKADAVIAFVDLVLDRFAQEPAPSSS